MSESEKIQRLGLLMRKKEKIDAEISSLKAAIGIGSIAISPPQGIPPGTFSQSKAKSADAPVSLPKSPNHALQGKYMATVRGLSAEAKVMVQKARAAKGIEAAIALAKQLKESDAEPIPEAEPELETADELEI